MSNSSNESTWDPMEEDYFDPTFNSYSQGPGSRLDRKLQPCFSKVSREKPLFKLYVKNIPPSLTEKGIKNVFLHFGNPLEIYRQPPVCGPGWAFVSYATHVEAELAIRKLNNMPPFYFRVQFARSPEEKERIRQERNKDELLQTVLEGESYPVKDERPPFNFFSRGIGRGRAIPFPRQMQMDTQPGKFLQQIDDTGFKELGYFSSYIPGIYHEVNRMVMQGINLTTDSAMGKRKVSIGRGYCLVNENIYTKQKDIKRKSEIMCDRVNNSMYEFGIKQDISELSGNCSYCNKMAILYCHRCRAWYCSRECQMSDWPCHKLDCIALTKGKSEKQKDDNVERSVYFNKTSVPTDRRNGDLNDMHNQLFSCENDTEQYKNAERNRYNMVTIESSEFQKPSVKDERFYYQNSELGKRTKLKELPEDKFTSVKITVTDGPSEYWVQCLHSESQLLEVMSILNNDTELSSLDKIEPDILCAALFENLWYRGRIVQVEPELRVLYIDFGNTENCTSDQLRSLPESVKNISPLSFKIKLAEGTSDKYTLSEEHKLNIKPIAQSDDGIIVLIEGEVYPEKQNQHSPRSDICNTKHLPTEKHSSLEDPKEERCIEEKLPKSVVLNLKPGLKGVCQMRHVLADGNMTATVGYPAVKEEFSTLFCTLLSFKISSETEHYKASVGETVAALIESEEGEETWMRAHVLAVDELYYCVNLCDVGHVTTVKKVAILPENLVPITEFAARCYIANIDSSKIEEWCKEQRSFIFTVLNVDNTRMSVTCSLESDTEQSVEAVFTPWVVENNLLRTVLLHNNDLVTLLVFFDHKSLFICPGTESARELFSKLQQDVGFHCLTAPGMTEMPYKNDIVACQFEPDGNYYRAQVLSVENETVKVTYIDFGNEDYVSINRLKPLREDLKKIQAMSVKVSLKNTVEKPMTVSACKLLTHLIGEEVEMTLNMSGPFKDGVELILPGGESLSNKINACLDHEPGNNSSENKIKECRIFTEDDLRYLELPLNKTIEFAVLHKLDSVSFMGCDANGGEVINYVHDSMSAIINKYCNSLQETSYVPRIGELCFARYEDGLWYRAVCISDGLTRENNVSFLDFGNLAFVDKMDIRKMTLEYAETPAVALFCMLKDLQSSTATDAQKKCVEELVEVNKIYEAQVISNTGPGIYIIEFPHVTEALITNGLLLSD